MLKKNLKRKINEYAGIFNIKATHFLSIDRPHHSVELGSICGSGDNLIDFTIHVICVSNGLKDTSGVIWSVAANTTSFCRLQI